MRELLLINNEPTPEDRGRIARAGELGLTDPLYNIDALAAKLSAFGTVTVRHYIHSSGRSTLRRMPSFSPAASPTGTASVCARPLPTSLR